MTDSHLAQTPLTELGFHSLLTDLCVGRRAQSKLRLYSGLLWLLYSAGPYVSSMHVDTASGLAGRI